jgi:hypothetical protein
VRSCDATMQHSIVEQQRVAGEAPGTTRLDTRGTRAAPKGIGGEGTCRRGSVTVGGGEAAGRARRGCCICKLRPGIELRAIGRTNLDQGDEDVHSIRQQVRLLGQHRPVGVDVLRGRVGVEKKAAH